MLLLLVGITQKATPQEALETACILPLGRPGKMLSCLHHNTLHLQINDHSSTSSFITRPRVE
jgi:hypothetical protein